MGWALARLPAFVAALFSPLSLVGVAWQACLHGMPPSPPAAVHHGAQRNTYRHLPLPALPYLPLCLTVALLSCTARHYLPASSYLFASHAENIRLPLPCLAFA